MTALELSEPLPDMTEAEARAAVDAVRRDLDTMIERLNELWTRRAWLALGYGSWGELCVVEFPNRRLPRDERGVVVRELRAQGMSQPAIAEAVDAPRSTIQYDLQGDDFRQPDFVTGTDGKLYRSSVRADDAAFVDRVKALDPERVRALLIDDEDDVPRWAPSGSPITIDGMAIVVVADVDQGGADATAFGPFATLEEAEDFAATVPPEPPDGGYPAEVLVVTVADLADPTRAYWLDTKED